MTFITRGQIINKIFVIFSILTVQDRPLDNQAVVLSYEETNKESKHGHELYHRMRTIKKPNVKLEISSGDLHNIEKEYLVAELNVSASTAIPTPLQNHPAVIVEKTHLDTGEISSKIICEMTSERGTKLGLPGVTGPENYLLSKDQVDNPGKPQYGVPLYPPREIKLDQYTVNQRATDFYVQGNAVSVFEVMEQETDRYQAYPYNNEGYTYEDLYELYLFAVELNEKVPTTSVNSNSTSKNGI